MNKVHDECFRYSKSYTTGEITGVTLRHISGAEVEETIQKSQTSMSTLPSEAIYKFKFYMDAGVENNFTRSMTTKKVEHVTFQTNITKTALH